MAKTSVAPGPPGGVSRLSACEAPFPAAQSHADNVRVLGSWPADLRDISEKSLGKRATDVEAKPVKLLQPTSVFSENPDSLGAPLVYLPLSSPCWDVRHPSPETGPAPCVTKLEPSSAIGKTSRNNAKATFPPVTHTAGWPSPRLAESASKDLGDRERPRDNEAAPLSPGRPKIHHAASGGKIVSSLSLDLQTSQSGGILSGTADPHSSSTGTAGAREGTRLKARGAWGSETPSLQAAAPVENFDFSEGSPREVFFQGALCAGTAPLSPESYRTVAEYIRQTYGGQVTAAGAESVDTLQGNECLSVKAGAKTPRFGVLFTKVPSDRSQVAFSAAQPQAQKIGFRQSGNADPNGMATPDLECLYSQYVKSQSVYDTQKVQNAGAQVGRCSFGNLPTATPRGSKPSHSLPAPLLPFPTGMFFLTPPKGATGIAPTVSPPVSGGQTPQQPVRRVLQTAAAAQFAKTGVYRDIHISSVKRNVPAVSSKDVRQGNVSLRGAPPKHAIKNPWAFLTANQENRPPGPAPAVRPALVAAPRPLPGISAKPVAVEGQSAACKEGEDAPLGQRSSECSAPPPEVRGVSAASTCTRLSSHAAEVKPNVKVRPGFTAAATKSTTQAPGTCLTRGTIPAVSQKKETSRQEPSEGSVSMHVLRVSLCGKKTTLSHRGQLMAMASCTGGVLRAFTARDTGVRVVECRDHRELVFQLPTKELVPFKDICIVAPISQGSFGTVSRATWRGQTVAVKQAHGVLTQEALRSIAREMNSFRAMDAHPHIVKYLGMCLDPGCVGIVMEYLPGGSLFDLLYENKVLVAAERRLVLSRQLTQAVHYMHHEKRMVHRDLKTANLIVDGVSGLKLCDFGKTRSLEASGKLLLDDNGGSPRYMAPECFATGTLIDEKADIWGLACCLIEIFGGPIPFEEIHSNDGVIDAIMCKRMRPAVPSWFHPAARRLFERCFSWSPRERPSALEIARTLELFTASDLNAYGMNTRRVK
uniref:Tyrosine kinase-like (TKL) protein n=1 Tax=Toxoplasma gondii COUG TaxID=1074873 RepID=A0A2G8XUA1_TOXGO|nr:Tyrosine kinase-like (TKL) protein [Toxoplasma gondii COUG]